MVTKRIVHVNVLPGEPLDGTGTVCIHLFVEDEKGPFTEPSVSCLVKDEYGQHLSCKPTRGRLACDRKRTVAPVVKNNLTITTPRSNDPRAVTCLKCKATAEYIELMRTIKSMETGTPVTA